MGAPDWGKIKEVFALASEQPRERRDEFLHDICAGDPALREEVESLLEAGDAPEALIESNGYGAAALLGGDAGYEGESLGSYRIVREIGRGGMGTVYLGRRDDEQYRKLVAVKVVRRGMDTEDILSRFRTERQILASLDHPNIARLLDGGTTPGGLPYLVMEYVEGTPITDYCDRRRLTTNERLELFRTVCAAVQHAHQNLVVHRDIKPSNILITAEGTPKLLDFGIAKVLNPELSALPLERTRTELRVLTPDYASPEQARGEKLTTASDVYSLGVVLYELLTGHRPYSATGAPSHELARVISEQEPTRPSTAVSTVEAVTTGGAAQQATITPESVSRARDTQPDRLRRQLAGDLDNIVLMALRKEPQRRYGSAAQLSEDIRRHLEGLPVVARKDTFGYRAGKFVRRNKAGVAAVALVLLSLVGGIVATAWQARRATREARIAAQERDRARVEAAKAERINTFLQNILGSSSNRWRNPNPNRNSDATIKEALDEASRRAQSELADQPEVLAAVLHSLGESYLGQAKHDLAESHLRAALDIRRKVLGPEHQDTAVSLTVLSEALGYTGKFPESESVAREAVAIFRRARETGDVNFWFSLALNNLGTRLNARGDAVGGEQFIREALEASASLTGAERAARVVMYSNLSVSRGNQGDIDGAIVALQMAVEENRRLPGSGLEYGATLGNLASFLIIKGEYAQAEPFLRESLDVYRQIEGGRNQYTTWTLIYLADSYYLQGDYRRAREEVDRAMEIQRQVLPEGHIDFARSWTVLGKILTRTGEPARGEDYLRSALALRTRSLKPGHWRLAETQGALGENLISQKRYADAEPLLVESHDRLNASLSGRDPRTQEARRRLAALYEEWGKPDRSALFRQSPVSRQ